MERSYFCGSERILFTLDDEWQEAVIMRYDPDLPGFVRYDALFADLRALLAVSDSWIEFVEGLDDVGMRFTYREGEAEFHRIELRFRRAGKGRGADAVENPLRLMSILKSEAGTEDAGPRPASVKSLRIM